MSRNGPLIYVASRMQAGAARSEARMVYALNNWLFRQIVSPERSLPKSAGPNTMREKVKTVVDNALPDWT